jgi:cytochrome c biogenesis factor
MMPMILMVVGVTAMTGGAALMIRTIAHRRRRWSDRTTRRLAWAACAWTVLAAAALLFAPLTSTVSVSSSGSISSAPGAPTEVVTTTSRGTLLEHEGAGIVAVLVVPVAIALAGAFGSGPRARRRRLVAGWVLMIACVLGAPSLGIYFLPAPLALVAAGLKTRRGTAGREGRGDAGRALNPAG